VKLKVIPFYSVVDRPILDASVLTRGSWPTADGLLPVALKPLSRRSPPFRDEAGSHLTPAKRYDLHDRQGSPYPPWGSLRPC